MKIIVLALIAFLSFSFACNQKNKNLVKTNTITGMNTPSKLETATFGAGCFWCVEAVFEKLEGVVSVVSGYSGGKTDMPTYEEVCSGTSGHAEVVQVKYDPEFISYDELLEVFWQTHDPTTKDRQGNDIGSQYRSVIFYHDDAQKQLAEEYLQKLNDAEVFNKPIVTEIKPLSEFYMAETYHQDYFNRNKEQAYCQYVIVPKMKKMEEIFKEKLKKDS